MNQQTATAAPPVKKDHHFVPQMYLRAFADASSKQGELWRYGAGFKPQAKAPKGVAWEDYFYDAAAELPPEDNDIEDFFAEAETIAAPRLQKLREGDINLSDQEKSELATFISLLLTRTRAHREMVNTIVSKLHVLGAKETLETPGGVEDLIETNVRLGGERLEVQQVRDALQAVVDGNVKVEQSSKAWTIKQIFEHSEAVDDLIASMHWNLLEAPEGHAFITSDNPVLITDPIGRMQGPKGYRPSRLTQFQFPVSPKYLLVGDFRGKPGRVVSMSPEFVAKFNENQIRHAHKELYASFKSDELQAQVDQTFKDRPSLVPELPADLLKKRNGQGRASRSRGPTARPSAAGERVVSHLRSTQRTNIQRLLKRNEITVS